MHVLGSLGSNVGKQYAPQQYYSKKSIEAAKSTTSPQETTPKNNRGSLILENGPIGSLKGRSSVRRSMILPLAPDAIPRAGKTSTGLRGDITRTDSNDSMNVSPAQ